MHPRLQAKSKRSFLLNSVDDLGREIDPAVLAVAQEIGPRAIAYAERSRCDPAVAQTLLEQAAASVSETIRHKNSAGTPAVRDLEAYLFRTFLHLIEKERQKQALLEESLGEYARTRTASSHGISAENALLVNEALADCDTLSREIILRRSRGISWRKIAVTHGISENAAKARFRRALQETRKALEKKSEEGKEVRLAAPQESPQADENKTLLGERVSGTEPETSRGGLSEP